MRVTNDSLGFTKPYLRLRWAEVSFKFTQPIYLGNSRSLFFCPKISAEFYAFKHVPRGNGRVEAVPYLQNTEVLASIIDKKLGKFAGDLVRRGIMPLLQGDGPSTLPQPQLEEMREIARSLRKGLFYLKKEKLYVLADSLDGFLGATKTTCQDSSLYELDNATALPVILKDEEKGALLSLATAPAKVFHLFGEGFLWIWARLNHGTEILQEHEMQYRGYLQVDIEQIPEAIRIFTALLQSRCCHDKSITCKFLLSKIHILNLTSTAAKNCLSRIIEFTGYYEAPCPSKPVIVIYARNKEEILEILEQLSQKPEWQKVESERKHKNRREGSSAYINKSGQEFRTLCFNEGAGCAEDRIEAAERNGQDWRKLVNGAQTTILNPKED